MLFWKRGRGVRSSPVTREFDVIFVLPHMGRGGAQRVTSLVANAWSRQGKRICIVTWDGEKEDAHDLESGIHRVDMPSFIFEIMRGETSLLRMRLLVRDRLRRIERWARPRLPWRRGGPRKRRSPPTFDDTAARSELFVVRPPWWSPRRLRQLVALIALSADRSERRPAFRPISPWAKGSLAHVTLGYRVEIFRVLFSRFRAPVIMSLLTKTNIYVIEAARGLDVRVVISERNDPDLQQIGFDLASLRRLSYRNADAVTSNSLGILNKLSAFVPADKLRLLPNPVIVPVIKDVGRRENRFVAVARLVHQKGVDLLISAFAQIAGDLEGWTLEVVGDGPLLAELRAQADALGISNRVTFHGHVPDPIAVMQQCRVFVLPSRFEGMPNALLEAMASGLAPIVTDASPGPLESVSHETTGWVVPTENVRALAGAMLLLARDSAMTDRIAQQARMYVKEHDWQAVEPQWLDVLEGRR
jgi:glycosyltransferase involved in cell wall biosynthesis